MSASRFLPGRPRTILVIAATICALVSGLGLAYRASGLGGPTRLSLLVVDELKDMRDLFARFDRDRGIDVTVRYESVREIFSRAAAGELDHHYDAVFLPVNGTERLPQSLEGHLESGKVIMTSPLVLGLRPAAGRRLVSSTPTPTPASATAGGTPPGTGITWRQVAESVSRGELTFGMVEPDLTFAEARVSDEAQAALLTIASGLAEAPGALIPHEIYRTSPLLRSLRAGQVLRPATATELVDQFLHPAVARVDGVVAHESDVRRINEKADPQLEVHIPEGRTVSTRYILRTLTTAASPAAGEGVNQLTSFLRGPSARKWIAQRTYRRPFGTVPGVTFPETLDVETPRSSEILGELIEVYLNRLHYPTRVVFVLDISGSMRGRGITDLRAAFASLTGTVATEHGTDVQVMLLPFASDPGEIHSIEITAADPGKGLGEISAYVAALTPDGETALYAALVKADQELTAENDGGRESVTSIILITDGANTKPTTLRDFQEQRAVLEQERCTRRSLERCRASVFPVLVGDADEAQMRQLAESTGGKVHDARNVDLGQVLRDLTAGR